MHGRLLGTEVVEEGKNGRDCGNGVTSRLIQRSSILDRVSGLVLKAAVTPPLDFDRMPSIFQG
jgi:hypothetical protein